MGSSLEIILTRDYITGNKTYGGLIISGKKR